MSKEKDATKSPCKEADLVTVKRSEIQEKDRRIAEQDKELFKLRTQLAYMVRQRFGRKSERYVDPNQLTLFEMQELLKTPEPAPTEPRQEAPVPSKPKNKPKRKAIPADIPRKIEVIEPENLPTNARRIGQEVTERLEYKPGEFWVHRIVRPKYVIDNQDGVWVGTLPSTVIDKGIAGPSLLAHMMVAKYVDHLPFYRIIEMLKRAKVSLSAATVSDWFMKVSKLLEVLYIKQKEMTLSSGYIQADETSIRVQTKEKQGVTHLGYFWVYYAPRKEALFFEYNSSRAQVVPEHTLKDFSGALQTDGYSGYTRLSKKDKITKLACMAHTRRYFEQALSQEPDRVGYVLRQMQKLYTIEREVKDSTHQERKRVRQEQAAPILDELKSWMDKQSAYLPQSPLGKAIHYAQNQWAQLRRYIDDGAYLIDNNPIENKIRPVALGRKNYLFAGSHQAAQQAAIVYSLMAACKVAQVDPYQWLADILIKLPDYKANKVHELLPNAWKATQSQA